MLVSEGKILYLNFVYLTFMFDIFFYLQISLMYSSLVTGSLSLILSPLLREWSCVRYKSSRPFVLVSFPSSVMRIDSMSLFPPPSACSQYRCHLPKWHLWKLLNLKNKQAFDLCFFSFTCFLGQLNVLQMSEELRFLIVKIEFKESKHNLYP